MRTWAHSLLENSVDHCTTCASPVVTQSEITQFIHSNRLSIKHLGEETVIAGLQINWNRQERRLRFTQEAYTVKIVDRFGMSDCRATSMTMEGQRFSTGRIKTISENDEPAVSVLYSEVAGRLSFLLIWSRHEGACTVGRRCCFFGNPKWKHCKGLKRVLHYVNRTEKMGFFSSDLLQENPLDTAAWTNNVCLGIQISIGLGIFWKKRQQADTYSWCHHHTDQSFAGVPGSPMLLLARAARQNKLPWLWHVRGPFDWSF